jgi:hypothetical protein
MWVIRAGAQRALRLLGTAPGGDLAVDGAAALTGHDTGTTEVILRALADASLLVEHRPGRFTMHDLTREYAAGRADAAERDAALQRLAAWLVGKVESAVALLHPGYVQAPGAGSPLRFDGPAAAREWFAAELADVIAVIESGTALGCPDAVWRLAFACRFHFNGRLDGPTALGRPPAKASSCCSKDRR